MGKDFKNKIILCIIAGIILGITLIVVNHYDIIIKYILKMLRLTYPFLIGLVIAYLLTPITNKVIYILSKSKLKNKSYDKLNRISIAIVETIFILTLAVIIEIITVGVLGSGYNILIKLPIAFEQFKVLIDTQINRYEILRNLIGETSNEVIDRISKIGYDSIKNNFDSISTSVINSTRTVTKYIIDFIFGVLISIFALANRAQFKEQSLKILRAITTEKRYNKVVSIFTMIHNKFSKFFIGKTVDSVIIGIICMICMIIMDMPYVALVSIIVFITNIIPIIGPFIGAVPSIIIIFSESPMKAIYFSIFIIILQQIDGHIIGPKCIGTATGLNTFYVLFALILFGGLWGLVGMIVGVPLFAVIYTLISEVVNYKIDEHNKNRG